MKVGVFAHSVDRKAAVIAMARVAGCTCDPEVEVRPFRDQQGRRHVDVRHDGWCPLLQQLQGRRP
jgi:hypothetical protein